MSLQMSLSHGQADVERGFSVNKQLLVKKPESKFIEFKNLLVITLRGDFKTQPPVDCRFRPVSGSCHCLEQ